MPFKIYTYEDPYKLDKADFWSEISALPHFCSARTLVNGLKDVLGDSIKGLICPLDELVQHEEVYMQWTDNISLRVQQYSAFSAAFKQLLEKRRILIAPTCGLVSSAGVNSIFPSTETVNAEKT